MKRQRPAPNWPALVWIALPLLLALLYAVASPLFAPEPDDTNMAPENAVLAFRYRDFAAFDNHHVFPPPPVPWSEIVGRENNVPGLPGVDRARPVFEIQMPPNLRHNSALVVFPVSDPDQFERAFLDPELLEKGRVRRPKQMRIHGPWAAVGPDRETVNGVGRGDLGCEVRGEAWSLAVDVEAIVMLALVESRTSPWRGALEALGVDLDGVTVESELDSGSRTLDQTATYPGSARVARIARTWDRVRLWSYPETSRFEAELVPRTDSAVAKRLATLASAPVSSRPPPAPPAREARMWIWVPGGVERALLEATLFGCGVQLPSAWLGKEHEADAGVLVFGARAAGFPYAITLGVVTHAGHLPAMPASLGVLPEIGASRALDAGVAPLTVVDTVRRGPSPAGAILRRRIADHDLLAIGVSPAPALDSVATQLELDPRFTPPEPPGAGWRLVAAFSMTQRQAERVLDAALEPGGLLASLAGGPVEGALWSNGAILRLTAAVGSP